MTISFVLMASLFGFCAAGCDGDGWSNYNWGAGNVRWLPNCDFQGSNIDQIYSTGENCGQLCINNLRCNHFVHRDGTCYLKDYNRDHSRSPASDGRICGFLPWRI